MATGFTGLEIAVVGMAGRFPSARSVEELWLNLRSGVESISVFSFEELVGAGVEAEVARDPSYVPAAGVLADVDLFDADFFGFSPREAQITDPQHRVFLECAWEALEDAGYDPSRFDGLAGVYAGTSMNNYLAQIFSDRELVRSLNGHQIMIANDKDYLTTRVSYKLGLEGPAVTVQTACSTSLVAVHLACQALLNGECDLALAGGVSAQGAGNVGYRYQDGMVGSPDGHCRAFDEKGQGTVSGNGVGVVVLRRLEDAIATGDGVRAVIRGSAINNDGSEKVGFTAPRIEGQSKVIRAAQLMAEVGAETIGYIEAHGTGTPLGDPIEVAALTRAFRATTDRKAYCALGSIKTNIGHLDAAAGVAGLIKTVLALERRQIPPSLNFDQPNSKIDFANSPFYVNTEFSAWSVPNGTPRRAGVSSFGIGGTNAHAILEEAPPAESGDTERPRQLLLLSARSESALEAMTDNLAAHLEEHPELSLADVSYTTQVGRRQFEHRRCVVAKDREAAVRALRERDSRWLSTRVARQAARPVAFLFPGQGSQYPGMTAELYRTDPVFRRELDACCEILRPLMGVDPLEVLHSGGDGPEAAARLERTALAQPLLFAVEHSLARLWQAWGVAPKAMIGHSVGEYVAACLAGVFPLREALALMVMRGRLMEELPEGAMLTVPLGAGELEPWLEPRGLALAAINGPERCVVSGTLAAVEGFATELEGRGHRCRRLRTSHAFHSAMMEPVMAPFVAELGKMELKAPETAFLSNLTGTWIRAEEATDPEYWAEHLRRTVQFGPGLEQLVREPGLALLEVGPGPTLASLAAKVSGGATDLRIAASLPRPKTPLTETEFLLGHLGRLWASGVEVDWAAFNAHERRRRVPLPTYPFERRRYWIEPSPSVGTRPAPESEPPGQRFGVPSWRQVPLAARPGSWKGLASGREWLLFVDACGLGEKLVERLAGEGCSVTVVEAGSSFERRDDGRWVLDPGRPEGYDELIAELSARETLPEVVVHCWNVTQDETGSSLDRLEGSQELGFWSLFHFVRAIGQRLSAQMRIAVVSNNLYAITGQESPAPEKSTLLGPLKVVPMEYPGVTCRNVDVVLPPPASWQEDRLLEELLQEVAMAGSDSAVVALRTSGRWQQAFEPVLLPPEEAGHLRLRDEGVYVITGGLGAMGLAFAERLASAGTVRLALISRKGLPPRDTWHDWIESGTALPEGTSEAQRNRIRRRIRRLLHLEELGSEVTVLKADVADPIEMEAVVSELRQRFGSIRGVIHAAGTLDDGALQRKQPRAAEAVLKPKVRGTLVLDQVLAGEPLDFYLLCSSVSSLRGAFGQVDYCAANAFLDSFAQWSRRYGGRAVTSVNWDRWREEGMAVDVLEGLTKEHGREPHPLLGPLVYRVGHREAPTWAIFANRLSPEESWVLDDHRLLGRPVLPGTAYLEMARAAFRELTGSTELEIRDVYFWSPLIIPERTRTQVLTLLERREDGFAFRVVSVLDAQGRGRFQQHVTGLLRALPPMEQDPDELQARIRRLENVSEEELADLSDDFGLRWRGSRRCHVQRPEVLIQLRLDSRCAGDLETYELHPGLLDVAVGAAGGVLVGGAQIPLSYRSVRVMAPLEEEVFSYARAREAKNTAQATVTVDLSITDPSGRLLLGVDEFTKRRIEMGREEDEMALAEGRSASSETPSGTFSDRSAFPEVPTDFWEWLARRDRGLTTEEGVDAFARILCQNEWPQVIVSATVPSAREEGSGTVRRAAAPAEAGDESKPAKGPGSTGESDEDLEMALRRLWSEVLGVETVKTDDNFFELGGDSLLAIQMVAKAKEVGLELTPGQVFESQTFAEQMLWLSSVHLVDDGRDVGLTTEPYMASLVPDSADSARFPPPAIERVSREGPLPLSFAQQRLWFLQELDPGSAAYNFPHAVRIEGPLSSEALRVALEEVVRRHETLRTRFRSVDGKPEQIVDPPGTVPLPRVNLTALEQGSRGLEVRKLTFEEAHRAFDLTLSPLARAKLLVLGEKEHILLFTLHHIISDDDSIRIALEEVNVLYGAILRGEPSPLRDLPVQYVDYAAWQRRWIDGEVLEALTKYWRRQLAGDLPALELPADYSRPEIPTHRGRQDFYDLSNELHDELLKFNEREGVTSFITLLAVFFILLSRYSRNEDIVIGADASNRTRSETKRMIGFFVNMLVLRADLSGDPSFRAFLGRVRELAVGGFAHRELPYEKLVEALRPGRGLRGGALFQVVFNFINVAVDSPEAGSSDSQELVFERYGDGSDELVRFELMLRMAQTRGGLKGAWVYNTDLYAPATMRRMHGHFLTLLRSAIASPDAALSRLEMITAEEKEEKKGEKKARSEDARRKLKNMKLKLHASTT